MTAAPPIELQYVGFWIRLLASLIDTLLAGLIALPLLLAFYGEEALDAGIEISGAPAILIWYLLPAIAVIAFWSTRHATPGKMLFGARIVDARSGAAPSLRQHLVRYLGYFLSTFLLFFGYFWIAIDPRKQGWHDKLAGTVVVRPRRRDAEAVRFS